MLLAEAVREKEYLEKAISRLQVFIRMSCVSTNRYNVDAKIKELEEIYKKHQQTSIKIDRAKASCIIKINDTEFTISDAIVIRDTMEKKLVDYEKMLNDVLLFNSNQPLNTMDLDYIYKIVEIAATDVKHLDNAIQRAFWEAET